MAVNRDEFFAELNGLTEKEIEARLPSWDLERLKLAQEYLERLGLVPPKPAQQDQQEAVQEATAAALVAMQVAKGANTKAIAALILAVGALLAAFLSGLVVVLRY